MIRTKKLSILLLFAVPFYLYSTSKEQIHLQRLLENLSVPSEKTNPTTHIALKKWLVTEYCRALAKHNESLKNK